MDRDENIRTLVAVFVTIPILVAVLWGVPALWHKVTDHSKSQPFAVSLPVPRYPAAVGNNFVNACTANGGDFPSCVCVLSDIELRYTFAEFTQQEMLVRQTGVLPRAWIESAARC